MLTPLDIQNTKFSKSAVGYKKSEVDEFMSNLLIDFEALYKAYGEANERIKSLLKMLDSYKGIEDTMKNTLVVAQSSAEQLTSSARNEAEIIISDAKQKSNEIIARANDSLMQLNSAYDSLKREISMFIVKTKADFEVQIKALDMNFEKMKSTENVK